MRGAGAGVIAIALAILVGSWSVARADGELTVRGMYYKEPRTRVVQPMLDATFDVGERATGDAHFLVDAITSASAASGAGGVSFTEKRYEAGAGYLRTLGRFRLGGTAKYSTEPDYQALYGALHGEVDLFDKNVTVNLTLGAGHDNVDNSGVGPMAPRREGTLDTMLASIGVSQIVSEHGLVALSYDLIHQGGFQQNAYRLVSVSAGGGMLVNEKHPDVRTRQALAASIKWYFPSITTTVIGQYRFYADDWDLHAHTPELRVVKDFGDWVSVGARYRYHAQDAADFFRETYLEVTPDITADVKLSAFDSHLVGGRVEVTGGAFGLGGRFEQTRAELVGEYVVQHNSFGNALVSYVALVVPLEY